MTFFLRLSWDTKPTVKIQSACWNLFFIFCPKKFFSLIWYEQVNSLWIEDCIDHEELIDIQFFHRPMKPVGGSILAGCVIAQSGIEGRQRTFLSHLVSAMGAVSQDTFARRTIEAKNIFACTHLICPKPEGRKYEAAQSWGVAAVDIKWLLACAMTGSRENESSYPAGSDAPLPQEDRTARVLVPQSSPNVRPNFFLYFSQGSIVIDLMFIQLDQIRLWFPFFIFTFG